MMASLKGVFRRDADAIVARYERALTRERVLRDTAARLAEAKHRKVIHRIACDSALALTDASSCRVWLVLGSGEDVAVASAGEGPTAVRTEAGLPAMESSAVFTAPLTLHDGARGALVVMSDRELSSESKEALNALASQVALALETTDLTDELRSSEAIYRDLFENATDIIFTVDLNGQIESVNGAAERVAGYTAADAKGLRVASIVAPECRDSIRHILWTTLRSKKTSTFELDILTSSGRRVPVELTTRIIRAEGRPVGIHGIARDITERKAAEAALQHQATHDALTGLPNRTLLRERLEEAVRATETTGATPALLFVDLNRFKEVNDTYGHHCGDALLQSAAERLGTAVADTGMVSRLGGDEFAALLHDADEAAATAVAARVAACLDEVVEVEGNVLDVSGSVGIACYPQHGCDALELMRHADAAMYVAKRGRMPYVLSGSGFEEIGPEGRFPVTPFPAAR
jgi:diguanylate cyclase (GGDEF)-like protein/PAS domain S-box-containing protein